MIKAVSGEEDLSVLCRIRWRGGGRRVGETDICGAGLDIAAVLQAKSDEEPACGRSGGGGALSCTDCSFGDKRINDNKEIVQISLS